MITAMFGKLLSAFRGKPALIKGAGRLEEGQSKRIELGDVLAGGVAVILCRVDGELLALDDRCPHEEGRIVAGPLAQGRYAVCPLHNYRFDPRTGAAENASCKKARTYRVREVGGDAEVWV